MAKPPITIGKLKSAPVDHGTVRKVKPKTHPKSPEQINAGNTSAQSIIQGMLREFGLDSLGTWAWNRFKQTGSIDLVKMEMQDQPVYKTRFAGRLALQAQGVPMSEAEQISWEKSAHDLMKQAGMPPGFYDSPHDYQDLIANGVSVAELSQRVNDAFLKVTSAPPEIRQAMGEYYGAYSDSALAAFALDHTKAAPVVMRQIGAAEAGGYLAQQHVQISRSLAEHIADATQSQQNAIQQGAQQLGTLQAAGAFDARIGEQGIGIDTGVAATFTQDATAVRELQRQADQRAASGAGSERFDPNSAGAGGLGAGAHT